MREPGWFERWLSSPVHDLLRGRATGRGFAAMCLPSRTRLVELPVNQLCYIDKVARSTSWRTSDRKRVEGELVAEFQDCLAHGRPISHPLKDRRHRKQLIKHYRRERFKRRPVDLWVRRGFKLAGLAFVLFLVLYPVSVATRKPTIKTDYLAMINAPALAAPEAGRAWPHYRSVLHQLRAVEEELGDIDYYGERPIDPLWEQTLKFLERNEPILEDIRDAASYEVLGLPLYLPGDLPEQDALALYGEPLDPAEAAAYYAYFGVPTAQDAYLTHLGEFRAMARLLSMDAYAAIEQRDRKRFMRDIRAMRGLSHHVSELKFQLPALVGVAIQQQWMAMIEEAVRSDAAWLTDGDLVQLDEWLVHADARRHHDPQVDAWIAMDWVQASYTDNGRGGGRLTTRYAREIDHWGDGIEPRLQDPSWQRVLRNTAMTMMLSFVMPSRKAVESDIARTLEAERYDAYVSIWEPEQLQGPVLMAEYEQRSFGHIDMFRSQVAIGHLYWTLQEVNARRDGVRVAVALCRYKKSQSDWPESLDELVPDFLSEVPRDPATGDEMAYVLREGSPVVYSFGIDGDDDGGHWPMRHANYIYGGDPYFPPNTTHDKNGNLLKPANHAAGSFRHRDDPVDGDWVLFPQPIEPPAELPDPNDPYAGYGPYGGGYGGYAQDPYGEDGDKINASEDDRQSE